MLDVSRRKAVIIGGGRVAARKARSLLDAGAMVVQVVSPVFCDEIPPEVVRISELFRPEHLADADLVFAATDRADVNSAVVEEAHRRRLMVNRSDSDEMEPGDFTVPATLRSGELTVTVSAGGSPALAAVIRDGISEKLDPRWPLMAAAMKELRPRILESGWAIEQRREAFRWLACEQAMEMLINEGINGVWNWLLNEASNANSESPV